MTVAELIVRLQAMPPDAPVFHLWDGEPRTKIEHVYLTCEGAVGTADFDEPVFSDSSRPVDAPREVEVLVWMTPQKGAG